MLTRLTGMLTSGDDNPNCYSVKDHGEFCNIGDFIRVNLPDKNGKRNYMHVDFSSEHVYNTFSCCKTRGKVDEGIDKLTSDFKKQIDSSSFDQNRVTRCCVDGMSTCEDCGDKCDSCGPSCG
jgi:hypothetical protein